MATRSFLFLQGVATPFFKTLAQTLQQQGHTVVRVNFSGGDQFFSSWQHSKRFSQPLNQLPQWLQQLQQEYRFTDAILFGDTRPVHLAALPVLRQAKIKIHVYEEGYLRPDWITLEQDGVNGFSKLSTQPLSFWQQTQTDPIKPISTGKSFGMRAWHDLCYRLANTALKPWYPHYRTHRPYNAFWEYLGWAIRIPRNKLWNERQDTKQIQQLVVQDSPYYILPLQLDSDAQIRVHSPFRNMHEVLQLVLESFARHAPKNSLLVIKNHPLDTGLLRHSKTVKHLAIQLGIEQRIIFLETGHLPTLLKHTCGTVVVNSTTGTSALQHGSPTITLGTALFDLPGLTFQGGLDRFWIEGQAPNPELVDKYRARLIEMTQINGCFYTHRGIAMAVAGSLKALDVNDVSETLDETHAKAAGIFRYGGRYPVSTYQYKNP